MSDGYYDLGQACENGHAVNGHARSSPIHNEKHCSRCGARTITACPACRMEIRGMYKVPHVAVIASYSPPAFCHECGHPYPWTAAALRAAESLADEMGITDEEKTLLKEGVRDLVRETPNTPVAKTRFKKVIQKAGGEAKSTMRAILTNITSRAIIESIFGP